ncbi:alpha/beta hydrolase [uncultured Desulfosarcina sp.]|uniref:alpha/beta hydrolase n=1 Tax=uncultured Desulfosarcina sp. TaxID=218289 RepID=UPI0029C87972|nr:alpha/beta hydrolase [uncultured Desulfosarcina sp.]
MKSLSISILCLFAVFLFYFNDASAADRFFIERDSSETLAVFVHGFRGSHLRTWGNFAEYLNKEDCLKKVDFLFWGYPTRLFKKDEKIGSIGEHFKTEFDYLPKDKYKSMVLIAHSMGGLVVRSFIIQSLIDGKGEELSKIQHIILFGVPNDGSHIADRFPKDLNVQIDDLKTASRFITDLRKNWIDRVYYITKNDKYHRQIPVTTVVGFDDQIVTEESAKSFFPNTEKTDGDHFTMVKPNNKNHLSYKIVKTKIIESLPVLYTLMIRTQNSVNDIKGNQNLSKHPQSRSVVTVSLNGSCNSTFKINATRKSMDAGKWVESTFVSLNKCKFTDIKLELGRSPFMIFDDWAFDRIKIIDKEKNIVDEFGVWSIGDSRRTPDRKKTITIPIRFDSAIECAQ